MQPLPVANFCMKTGRDSLAHAMCLPPMQCRDKAYFGVVGMIGLC